MYINVSITSIYVDILKSSCYIAYRLLQKQKSITTLTIRTTQRLWQLVDSNNKL